MRADRSFLMVASQFPPVYGGAGTQALALSRALVRRGWHGHVVTLDQADVGSSGETGLKIQRCCKGVKPRGRGIRAWTTAVLGLTAALQIIATRPRVVHIHGAFWWSIPPAIAGRVVGATVVTKTTRDGDDDALTVMTRKVVGIPVGWLYGMSLRLAHHVIVLNSASAASAELVGLRTKVSLLTNGVETSRYERSEARRAASRKKFDIPPDTLVVTFVGFMVRHKGILDLLNAWRRWQPVGDAQLWLVGPEHGFYRELTSDAVNWLDSSSSTRIRRFGHTANEELPHIYWATDVFVLPSYQEGMPNALLEAIVAGCQVVATTIPGIIDVVDDRNAYLVEPGDVASLVEAFVALERGGGKDLAEVAKGLSMDRLVDRYEVLYLDRG